MSSDANNSALKRTAGIALIVGLIGIAIAAFGFYQGYSEGDSRPLMSWLIGIAFWLSIAVGMLFLTQIWYVFHARWPVIIRRQCEHAFAVFPVLFLLFIPLLLVTYSADQAGLLWKWLDGANALPGHGTVGEDPIFQWKSPYLNHSFFVIRSVLVFGVFIGIAYLLRKFSFDTDKTGNVDNTHRARVDSPVPDFSFVPSLPQSVPSTGSSHSNITGSPPCTVSGSLPPLCGRP